MAVKMNLNIGDKYNHLTIVDNAEDYITPSTGRKRTRYLCECDCENHTKIIVIGSDLLSGKVKSCGCYQKEAAKKVGESNKKHGLSKTPVGQSYYNMISKYSKENIICSRWVDKENGILNFVEDMEDSYKEGLVLGRRDTSKEFNKENCIWIPLSVKQNASQRQHNLDFDGISCTATELNRALGFSRDRIINKLGLGKTLKEAMNPGKGIINAVSFINEYGRLVPAETEKIPGFDNLYAGDQTIAKQIISGEREYTFGQLIDLDKD